MPGLPPGDHLNPCDRLPPATHPKVDIALRRRLPRHPYSSRWEPFEIVISWVKHSTDSADVNLSIDPTTIDLYLSPPNKDRRHPAAGHLRFPT